MVQNHLFQLLCLISMEPPVSLEPDAIRDEKVKVLQALRPVDPDTVSRSTVRGQYAAGVIDGDRVVGYREEPSVAGDSRTETYAALRVLIDNWRWAGVPFYLRAGKRMPRRVTEIALRFNDVPHRLFPNDTIEANTLALRIQPDEGINLNFDVKVPGTEPHIEPVTMDFDYGTSFGDGNPEAYERLVLDALYGDSTLFIRRDEVESAWGYIDRLHEGWSLQAESRPLPEYAAGTWGPAEADVMLAKDSRAWRKP
jgi:glucose-6-phosphate 1-dehydrogenase